MAGSSSLSERSHSTDGEKTSQLKIRQVWCGKKGRWPRAFSDHFTYYLGTSPFFHPRPHFLHARLIFAWPCFLDVPTILGSGTVYSTKNESYWVVFSCGTVYHATLCGSHSSLVKSYDKCDLKVLSYASTLTRSPTGGEGVVLPYRDRTGMCYCEGYGFQAVYSGKRYCKNKRVWVSPSRKLINWFKILA